MTNTIFSGLTNKEAENILLSNGFNELPSQKNRNSLNIFLKVISEPMLLLLIGCGTIYLLMGEPKDAAMLISFVTVVVGITFYQERKTEKTLAALKNLSSPRALVIREGKYIRLPGREVVKGDVIVVKEGDRIPADAVLLSAENLSIDESLLTGESVPVRKSAWDGKLKQQKPGGDDLPFVYSGSMVIAGQGIAKVRETGIKTEMGKIGKTIESIKEENTLLRIETNNLVRIISIIGVALCSIVAVSYVLIHGNVVQGILSGLTLGMSIIPEEIPVILVIFLTLGAWRISKSHVLTRHSSAIETLGAATVLCTDKTGTLTKNIMELATIYKNGQFHELNTPKKLIPEDLIDVLEYGVLSSKKDPYDPIEKELVKVGVINLKDEHPMHYDWKQIKEYPISKEIRAITHVWQTDTDNFLIASKGAPEDILKLCHTPMKLQNEILEKVKMMSEKGLRILGVAKSTHRLIELPEDTHDFIFEFVGLLGFRDPVRPTAADAVKEAYTAGLRVIMITGDYAGTAQYIAKQIGIKNSEDYISGEDIEKMSLHELKDRIKNVNICARVIPEQKLAIVNALKSNGEIVAMTGDGVNDAPALKAAHIGIAMGERGTDVAREAASLVLLDDDFSSIVTAVRLGRRIYDNLKRALGYTLAVHIPIVGMSLFPLLMGFPVVLLPAHIAFMELIIDPACSTVFESEKEDSAIMTRPPRNIKKPIFSKNILVISILQGISLFVATFALYLFSMDMGKGELISRSIAFSSMVIGNLLLIVLNLSWTKTVHKIVSQANKVFIGVVISALVSLALVLYLPLFSVLFHLAPLKVEDLILAFCVVILSLSWFEVLKIFRLKVLI